LVRAQALARAQHVAISGRDISDFVRSDRVEGLALGQGLSKQFGHGIFAAARARYGIDDERVKGSAAVTWEASPDFSFRVFGLSDFRDTGDQEERSGVVNTIASQEFGSDYTDPYRVRGAGVGVDFSWLASSRWRVDASVEQQDSLSVHARPVVGGFEPTIPAIARRVFAVSTTVDRRPMAFVGGSELTLHGSARATFDLRPSLMLTGFSENSNTIRGALHATIDRPVGDRRLLSTTAIAGLGSSGIAPTQELVYLGGPVSAPGFDYHALRSTGALAEHLEWQFPVPFPSFSLGRFGRVPGSATLAPYVHAVGTFRSACDLLGTSPIALGGTGPCLLGDTQAGIHPSIGAALLSPFDLLRIDVAKGFGRGGRWTFNVDVSREFWRIL